MGDDVGSASVDGKPDCAESDVATFAAKVGTAGSDRI
jgi:hypothetical protein